MKEYPKRKYYKDICICGHYHDLHTSEIGSLFDRFIWRESCFECMCNNYKFERREEIEQKRPQYVYRFWDIDFDSVNDIFDKRQHTIKPNNTIVNRSNPINRFSILGDNIYQSSISKIQNIVQG